MLVETNASSLQIEWRNSLAAIMNVSCADILKKWDAGEEVISVSMGGWISDGAAGYESIIQFLGFEMVRWFLDNPVDNPAADGWPRDDKEIVAYTTKCDDVIADLYAARLGTSGMQHSAALNMAAMYARNGYAKALTMAPVDRLMKVTKVSGLVD